MIKQILSLPTRTADPAVYILSGLLPVETQIHIRALRLFNNICNQADGSVEKTLARRQLIVKSNKSNSWFIEIKSKPIVEYTPYYNGLRYLSCVNLEKGKTAPNIEDQL
jgi:hypothetical protein